MFIERERESGVEGVEKKRRKEESGKGMNGGIVKRGKIGKGN